MFRVFVLNLVVFVLCVACVEEGDETPVTPSGDPDPNFRIVASFATARIIELEITAPGINTLELLREGVRIAVLENIASDTVFTDRGLEPAHEYAYEIKGSASGEGMGRVARTAASTLALTQRSLGFEEIRSDVLPTSYIGVYSARARCAASGSVYVVGQFYDDPLAVYEQGSWRVLGVGVSAAAGLIEILPDETVIFGGGSPEKELFLYRPPLSPPVRIPAGPQSVDELTVSAGGELFCANGKELWSGTPSGFNPLSPWLPLPSIVDMRSHGSIVYVEIYRRYDQSTSSASIWRHDGHELTCIATTDPDQAADVRLEEIPNCMWVSPSGTLYLGGNSLYRINDSRLTRIDGLPNGDPALGPQLRGGIYDMFGLSDADFIVVGNGPFYYHFNGENFTGQSKWTGDRYVDATMRCIHMHEGMSVMIEQFVHDYPGPSIPEKPVRTTVLLAR